MYLTTSDGEDRSLDLTNLLAYSLAAANNWLQGQVGQKFNLDTYLGKLDMTFARLPRTDAEYMSYGYTKRNYIEADLRASGLLDPGKIYMVYYEGSNDLVCAEAAFVTQRNRDQDRVAVFYLKGVVPGAWPCGKNPSAATPTSDPQWFEFVELHEMLHLLGVPHVSDPCDLMGTWVNCGNTRTFDTSHQSYYRLTSTTPAATTDVASSPYLNLLPIQQVARARALATSATSVAQQAAARP